MCGDLGRGAVAAGVLAGSGNRPSEDVPQLFGLRKQFLIACDVSISHELEPINHFIAFFGNYSQLGDELCSRAAALRCAIVRPYAVGGSIELSARDLSLWRFRKTAKEAQRGKREVANSRKQI